MCSSDLVVIPYSGLDDGTLRVLRVRAESRNYCRRGGNLKSTKTETSAKLLPMHPSLKHSLQEWRSQSVLQQAGRFRIPFRKTARHQAVRPSVSPEKENTACIQTDRNHGCGLAHVPTFGWSHAGGDGRTSTHNPRLLAAQQPSCHEQVPEL